MPLSLVYMQVITASGRELKLKSAIGPYEGMHMYNIIRDNKFTKCCEVGMANGMSALYICQVLVGSVCAQSYSHVPT